MAPSLFLAERTARDLKIASDLVHLHTEHAGQFVDLTELVSERVRRSGIQDGLACVQSLHTTAALLVNENEPLLQGDMRARIRGFAPREAGYAHDDWDRRDGVAAGERRNGHSHCQALILAPSVSLVVAAGRLLLGAWQRIFLVELDDGRPRGLAVVVMGSADADDQRWS
jgi:secondary thiamine-phosphate synthase enzyme